MSSNKDKRRVRNVRIQREYIIGNEAWHITDGDRSKDPRIPANHKFHWKLYIKNREGAADFSYWLEKVIFKIHDDYKPNNLRCAYTPVYASGDADD
jgi:transcription initiation factor IIF auxiliary subunit